MTAPRSSTSLGQARTSFFSFSKAQRSSGDKSGLLCRRQRPALSGAEPQTLKQSILQAANRLRRREEWSLAVLVPANVLAASIFDYMGKNDHGLPRYPVEILVSAEGPMFAGELIALLLEPQAADSRLARWYWKALPPSRSGATRPLGDRDRQGREQLPRRESRL
jgi:hypothetical protein